MEHLRPVDLRDAGVDSYLNIVVESGRNPLESFEEQHRALYGYVQEGQAVEVVNIRVESIGRSAKPEEVERDDGATDEAHAAKVAKAKEEHEDKVEAAKEAHAE